MGGGRYFVLDCAMGIVASAMAQQLASTGKVYRAIQGGASTKGVDDLDVGAARYAIRVIPMEVLQAEDPWKRSWLTAPSDSAEPADEAQAAKAEKAKEKIRTRCTDFKDFA